MSVELLLVILQPQYKESEIFLARFKQCLSRALNLMKTHVMNILQAATLHVKNAKVCGIHIYIQGFFPVHWGHDPYPQNT